MIIIGGRLFFLESLMGFELAELREMALSNGRKPVPFKKRHFLLRGGVYLLIWMGVVFLAKFSLFNSMLELKKMEFYAAVQDELFLNTFMATANKIEIYITFGCFICFALYELYQKRKSIA
ncbi:MAG: hypothetical protein PHO62_07700 [Sulfurimonas sp.]|uniref:hypothetical protein n=1 Tax=Sulfurimonas sp. TaxID=2022749 RepID=UPI00262B0E98|nr:hypothetical protein [Sulfurimonas sp.]MDD5373290.1 hypothetical protein [Sulfurimonas sp.]